MSPSPRRVLLLNPGSLYGGGWAKSVRVKPALVSLFSYLAFKGVPIDVLDLQVELGNPLPTEVDEYLSRARGLIAERDFDLLAVSCWSSLEYLAAHELARWVRETVPDVPIVVGGYHAGAVPEDFTGPSSPFDVVVRGEGERTLASLACAPSLPESAGPSVVDGEPLPLEKPIVDLAGYPYADDARQHGVGLYLSRGCPYRCAFCMESSRGSSWRAYPVARAVDLMRAAAARKPRVIYVLDACFAYRARWRREFLKSLIDEGIDTPIWAELRADRLTVEDLDLIARLDVHLQFGVETMSPAMAQIMRKAPDGERYVRMVDDVLSGANDRRLLTQVFLIFNHPGETHTTAGETIAYVNQFVDSHDHLSVFFHAQSYAYFPGSDVARRLGHYESTYGTRVLHPGWWRESDAHHRLATDVRGSVDFDSAAPYLEHVRALNVPTKEKMPPATKLQLLSYYMAPRETNV